MADVIVGGEMAELTYMVDGEDIMPALLQSEGHAPEYVDGGEAYRLTEDEFERWVRWMCEK